jgi:hypothetical protein
MTKSAPFRSLGLWTAALAIAAGVGIAQIERLDLPKMVSKIDDAVVGKIIDKHAIRIDHPIDGPELYFTHLTIEGKSLVTGEAKTVVVTYHGGWIDAEQGCHNSEAPTEDETKQGNEVVVFYKWTDNMGGDLQANAMYASHGGLYEVANGRNGKVVLGRGDGYAVSSNVLLSALDTQITEIWNDVHEGQGK